MKRRYFFFFSLLLALNIQVPSFGASSSAEKTSLQKNLMFVLPAASTRGENQLQNLSDGGGGKIPLTGDLYEWTEIRYQSQTKRLLGEAELPASLKSQCFVAHWSPRGPPSVA